MDNEVLRSPNNQENMNEKCTSKIEFSNVPAGRFPGISHTGIEITRKSLKHFQAMYVMTVRICYPVYNWRLGARKASKHMLAEERIKTKALELKEKDHVKNFKIFLLEINNCAVNHTVPNNSLNTKYLTYFGSTRMKRNVKFLAPSISFNQSLVIYHRPDRLFYACLPDDASRNRTQ